MIRVNLLNEVQNVQLEHERGPLEFGRGPQRHATRCVVKDPFVSGNQLVVEELPDNRVRLENLSQRTVVQIGEAPPLAIGETREYVLPIRLAVGKTKIEIQPCGPVAAADYDLETVERPTQPCCEPGDVRSLVALGDAPSAEILTRWFETVVALQRAAAGTPEFFDETARALVTMVGLDVGMVLLREGGDWRVAARAEAETGRAARGFSRTVLKQLLDSKRTFFGLPAARVTDSLKGIHAVVASPVLRRDGEVVGSLYGVRNGRSPTPSTQIRPLEAKIVQLLASTIAVGLARQEQEAEAVRSRVQFEQFFSPVLARELARNPNLLEGRERLVTILFADLRGFSKLSERIGPAEICRIVSDVMDVLTTRIAEHHGVVVDYQGDGLMAMWNAPQDEPDHAERAARTGLLLIDDMTEVSRSWHRVVGADLEIGVGINTGSAQVGNIGSRRKFKYGPMGATVNVASRVEGATKQLGAPVLVTNSTRALLSESFASRRVCRARLAGMQEPIDLFEIRASDGSGDWPDRARIFEAALAELEEGRFQEAWDTLFPLLAGDEGRRDGASMNLAARIMKHRSAPSEQFDPVLALEKK